MKHVRTLKRSALALAIAMAASAPLHAQSNSQGYIFGQVSGGGSVVVENLGTGQKREIAVDADGNFFVDYGVPVLLPGMKVVLSVYSIDQDGNRSAATVVSYNFK